jgi:aminomethyltransferase
MLVKDEVVPASGDRVFAAGSEIGHVTSATYSPSLLSPIALGYVARDYLEPGSAITIAHGDRRLTAVIGVLPFVAPNT